MDLNASEILWQVPVGENEDGVRGLMNYCPPLLTGSGLIFHGGTKDQRLWVYDAITGERITFFELPADLHAGPITYKLSPEGRQFLVVAPGGHRTLNTKLGDYIIAYFLPDRSIWLPVFDSMAMTSFSMICSIGPV